MSKQKDNKRIGKSLDKGKRSKPFGKDTRGNKPKETTQNKPSKPSKPSNPSDGIRLNKYIANSGICSRREDDDFMQKFTRRGVTRLFHIELDKNLKAEDIQRIKDGLKIDGKTIDVEEVSWVNNAPKKEVGLKIKHIGNSVIRTIFDHLNYNVVKVDCVTIGPLTKKDLPRGRWRDLNELEMNNFSML